jgi:uncharacterized protein YceK
VNKLLKLLLLFALIISTSGCVAAGINISSGPTIYGGTRMDLGDNIINNTFNRDVDNYVFCLSFFDLPTTFVLDTLVLPWSVYNYLTSE